MTRLVLAAAAVLALPLSSACASRYKLDANAPTYAAQAKIRVEVNKTDNREVDLTLLHLAPPSRIPGGYRGYVVWFRVPGHAVTKAGVLDYNERRRRGELEATTPHPKFELFVTLERDTATQTPGSDVILRKIVGAS
jgi:hypothetical protein